MKQISESLQEHSVSIADVKLPVSELCGGVLFVGQSGSGKTALINDLAGQFSRLGGSARECYAIIYFALKGRGHRDFLSALPRNRRKDVIVIGGSDSPAIRLFWAANWACAEELQLATVQFLEEVADHVAGAGDAVRHDPFWDRQRLRILSELARLTPVEAALGSPPISDLFRQKDLQPDVRLLHHPDAHVALLARVEAFLQFIADKSTSGSIRPNHQLLAVFQENGFGDKKALTRAKQLVEAAENSPKNHLGKRGRDLCRAVADLLDLADQAAEAMKEQTLLDRFQATLDVKSQKRLAALIEQFWRIPNTTRGCIEADLRGVVECFRSGPAQTLFRPNAEKEITIEEIVDRGRIAVIDLPLAESGGASLAPAMAIKIALARLLAGRLRAGRDGKTLNRRGVLVVQDEAHLLLSKPKSGLSTEALTLSIIREMGVVWILAAQSLSLIAGALRGESQATAFASAARTRIFGGTADEYTARLSSALCGTTRGPERRLACMWHPTPGLDQALIGVSGELVPAVPIQTFYQLQTGQFVLRTAQTDCYLLDIRFNLPHPTAQKLNHR